MGKQERDVAIRGIVVTSYSEDEIQRRVSEELGIPEWAIMLTVDAPATDAVGMEALDLVRALGGLVTANGLIVLLLILPGSWDDDVCGDDVWGYDTEDEGVEDGVSS